MIGKVGGEKCVREGNGEASNHKIDTESKLQRGGLPGPSKSRSCPPTPCTHSVPGGKLSRPLTVADPRPCIMGLKVHLTETTESSPVIRIRKKAIVSATLFPSTRWSFTGYDSQQSISFCNISLFFYTLFLPLKN